MERPAGVTVLAVLNFLGAGLCVLGGLAFMVDMGIGGAAAASRKGAGMGAFLVGLGAVGGVVLLVFAVIAALVGIGLWTLRGWARTVTIVLSILGLVVAVPAFFISLLSFRVVHLIFLLTRAGISALIVWYMFRPHVKQAFGAA